MVASGLFAFVTTSALAFSLAKSPSSVTWRWSPATKVVRVDCAGLDELGFAKEQTRAMCARAVATWRRAGARIAVGDEGSEVRFVVVNDRPSAPAGFTARDGDAPTGVLRRATIEVNGALAYALFVPAPEGALDLQTLITHELGHALGLGHSLNPRAVMRAGIKAGRVKRALHRDDLDAVAALGFSG